MKLLLLMALGLPLRAADVAALPAGATAHWDKTPVETPTLKRAEMVLNDLWWFLPARRSAAGAPAGQWGWIRVPGTWERGSWDASRFPGVVAPGQGDPWDGLRAETPSASFPAVSMPGIDRAWVEREVNIPADWAGRRIVLDVERVSTDAQVFLNGEPCGEIHWPGGSVDVTRAAKPGQRNRLRLLVVAAGAEGEVRQFMDADRVTTSKAVLKHRGIIGDVVLSAMPMGPRLDGVFIKPSVAHRNLGLDVEFAGLTKGGSVNLTISATNARTAATEKSWDVDLSIPAPDAAGTAVVRDVELPWADPALWDFRQPNLYVLRVAARGAGWSDEIAERFGFREFRISGRQFLLNGRPFNFRPHLIDEKTPVAESIAMQIDGLLGANFNVAEIWPDPDLPRGNANNRPLLARVADEKGLPLLYALGDPSGVFDPTATDLTPETWAAWSAMTHAAWKRVRNSPSVLVFMVAGNRFAHADDQNPRRIGNRAALDFTPVWKRERQTPGMKLINAVKALDPTRPVTSHHNANVGDFHTSNNYLNLHPLQEREDWLAIWAKSGDMPYSAVEFDAPFAGTMNRGRKGHTGESTTEPWLTEFLAIYDGPAAYQREDPEYRAMIARTFKGDQDYEGVNTPSSKAFSPFAAWWITRTLRAWRGYGISGGMVHWSDAYGWRRRPEAENQHRFAPFAPGQRGAYVDTLRERMARGNFAPEIATRTPSGDALVAGYAPTLAWIAGPPDAFTAQHHVFTSGETITRSAGLINDAATPQPYALEWTVELGGKPVQTAKASGMVPVGVPQFVPFPFPAATVAARTDGTLRLRATIGNETTTDAWPFRVLPPAAPLPKMRLAVLDFEGTTSRWLGELGVVVAKVAPPNLGLQAPGVLVVGRNAIARCPASEWPGVRVQIERFVVAGGRVLIMAQDPEWLRTMSGLRVARHVGRRFWPVSTQAGHPLVAGLDGEDFRDWRGAGSLVDPAPTLALDRPLSTVPRFGWHVNNSGSVASAAIEKPHFGRWTPLIEGEFDLAFSPLMEARLGRGLLVWCGLDLDGRTAGEPAADAFSRRLLGYLAGPLAPATPEGPVTYLGGGTGQALLDSMGVDFQAAKALPARPGLVVIGEECPVADGVLEAFVRNGGRVVLLGDAAAKLGFKLAPRKLGGASNPPSWPEARGLSASDLRLRVDFESPRLVEGGNEVAANGLLGRKAVGRGVVIAFPLTPDRLPADEKTYFRFSQWRLTRALSQVLTNLGARFRADAEFLDFKPHEFGPIPLAGPWKVQEELLLPAAGSPDQPNEDPGRAARTTGWEKPGFDDSRWKVAEFPMDIERAVPAYAGKDGAFWFRRTFDVPADYADETLLLKLGPIDDFDEVWVNGTRIGKTPAGTKDAWSLRREYKIRPGILQAGTNTIAVRCFDQFGGGGFTAPGADSMRLELARPPERAAPYVSGYRTDQELGDDYARYYRW